MCISKLDVMHKEMETLGTVACSRAGVDLVSFQWFEVLACGKACNLALI